jgi:hypothetical protein
MALGDVYKLQSFANYLGQINLNVFAVEVLIPGDPTQANFQALATDFKEVHRPLQSPRLQYRSWRAVQVRGGSVTYVTGTCRRQGGLFFEGNAAAPTNGGGAGPQDLPPQCAFVTTLKSNQIGRSRRGRIYAGAYTEDNQDGGQWTTTLVTGNTTAWATFMAKYNASTGTDPTFRLAIWSERIATGCVQLPGGGHQQTNAPAPENASIGVYSVVHRTTVHTQRRRVVGVGL